MEDLLVFLTLPEDFDLQWTVKAVFSHFSVGYIISVLFYLGWMRLFAPLNKKNLYESLVIAPLSGLVSLLIDADHIVMFFGQEKEYSRPAHPLVALIAALIIWNTTWRLVELFWEAKVYKKSIDIKAVRLNTVVWIWSLCLVAHVAEDYLIGWF